MDLRQSFTVPVPVDRLDALLDPNASRRACPTVAKAGVVFPVASRQRGGTCGCSFLG